LIDEGLLGKLKNARSVGFQPSRAPLRGGLQQLA
jgi:hypothetical protein